MQTNVPKISYSMELLARRLSAVVDLSATERQLLMRHRQDARSYRSGSEVVTAHEPLLAPTLIVSGWACRERITPSGHRQLLSILLPGDVIGGIGEQRPLDLVGVVAITNLKLINVASPMRLIAQEPACFPGIIRGLSMLRLAEERRLLDQMVRLGSQAAFQRTAGFLLELFQRCRAIDFVTGAAFLMPLTQEMLASALGLSLVHVNRVLRQLKAQGLIHFKAGIIEILDMAGLVEATDVWPGDCVRPRREQGPRFGAIEPPARPLHHEGAPLQPSCG